MLNFGGVSTSNKFHWKSLFSSLDQLRRRRVGIQIAVVPSCHCRSKKTLRPILQFDDTYYHTISAYLIWVSVSKTGCNLCAEICSDVSVKFKHHRRAAMILCFEMFWEDCSREYSCLAKIIRNKIAELSSHLFFLQQPQGLLSQVEKKQLCFLDDKKLANCQPKKTTRVEK